MKQFIKAKSNTIITLWLFLFSTLLFLSFSIADPDFLGHLKFGQTICESKSIPKTDIFSYTAEGLEWINHEWLAEAVFWIFYKSFSDYGLVFLRLAVGLIFCFFLWLLVGSENITGSIIAFLLILFTVVPFWHFRPQIFTFLFFAILIYLLKNEKLLPIPVLFLFWANTHGGFVAGIAYFFIFLILSPVRKKLSRVFIVSLALTFVNPYGWKLWYGIFRAFFNPLTREYIVDWHPLRFFDVDFAGYWGLLLIFMYFIGRNIKKIRITEIVLPILFLALSFTSVRHIPIFAIVSALTIGKFFKNVPERIYPAPHPSRRVSLLFAEQSSIIVRSGVYSKAVLVIAAVLTVVALSSIPKVKITIDKEAYPVDAVEYLKSSGFKGNIFCEFDWGEYIIWCLYPGVKVSFDGRYDTVYPVGLIKANFELLESGKGTLPENTDAVIIYSDRPPLPVLSRYKQVYSDKVAKIFKIR